MIITILFLICCVAALLTGLVYYRGKYWNYLDISNKAEADLVTFDKEITEKIETLVRKLENKHSLEINSVKKKYQTKFNNSLNKKTQELEEKYKEKYSNIKLLEQPNSGVSKARNNGIKNALGKYIMLLDSDDTISKSAIKNLFNFFEQHYNEIDIVTYPIKFNRHGKITKNIRYDAYDKGTGIYDVNEYIYLNQSTVNIMIKNEFENTNLYNENMKLSEDQNFDTEMIMKKEKLGYVNEAIYYYNMMLVYQLLKTIHIIVLIIL